MVQIITDEQLSIYLDGGGDAYLRDNVERALLEDEALRARLESFQRHGNLLRDAIDAELGAVPDRLQRTAPSDISFARPSTNTYLRWIEQYWALAAVVLIAFTVGFGLDYLFRSDAQRSVLTFNSAGLSAGPELAKAFSTIYSGTPEASSGGEVSIELTFRNHSGHFCRVFRIEEGSNADVGITCRKGDLWVIEGWVTSRPLNNRNDFSTASGPHDAAIDTVIDQLGIRMVLNRDDEVKAIRSGWNTSER